MNDIIEALKENEKPFGLMSKEMQAKAKEIGIINFQYWNFGWDHCQIRDWDDGACYRLHPDYEEKPEIVECEVTEARNGLLVFDRVDGVTDCCLATAVKYPDFIGFKYEDDPNAYPDPRRYRDSDGLAFVFWVPGRKALTPTHVLFRSKT